MFKRSRGVPLHEEGNYEAGAPSPASAGTSGAPAATPSTTGSPATTTMPVTSGGRAHSALPVAPAVVNRGAGFGLASVGLLTILLGAWAGIIPFVGPLFAFRATSTGAWVWNLSHALLWLAPGAVAVVLGIMMVSRAPLARVGMARMGPMWAGFLVACCGAWLVVGPFAWPVLKGSHVIRGASPLHELAYWIGYSLGPGILLVLLGGCAVGVSMLTRRAASAAVAPSTLSNEAIAA